MPDIPGFRARILSAVHELPGFRSRLLADPARAISEEFGIEFGAEVTIEVIEETPELMVLVLPAHPRRDSELTDDDLRTVAGGTNELRNTNCVLLQTCWRL